MSPVARRSEMPLRLLALLVCVTILPSALLVVLGWKLFDADREGLARQPRDLTTHADRSRSPPRTSIR